MKIKKLIFAALLTLTCGCTHFANVQETTSADGIPTYVSSKTQLDGTHIVVTERVLGSDDRCDILEFKREYYDACGQLETIIKDRERCGIVELRIRKDFWDDTVHIRIDRDNNRDGSFEWTRIYMRTQITATTKDD